MAKLPCSSSPTLCDQQPNPLTSFSSEQEDSPTFLSIKWSSAPPLLNRPFNNYPCVAFGDSQTSQSEANRIARLGALVCTNPCENIFSNSTQTATADCAGGGQSSFTVPAGEYFALDQLTADRIASTVASQIVSSHAVCLGDLSGGSMSLGFLSEASMNTIGAGAPFSFEIITGALPPGITMMTSDTGIVFLGVPSHTGIFEFTVQVTNSFGVTSVRSATISVVVSA